MIITGLLLISQFVRTKVFWISTNLDTLV